MLFRGSSVKLSKNWQLRLFELTLEFFFWTFFTRTVPTPGISLSSPWKVTSNGKFGLDWLRGTVVRIFWIVSTLSTLSERRSHDERGGDAERDRLLGRSGSTQMELEKNKIFVLCFVTVIILAKISICFVFVTRSLM